ncbi:substrate-binding domain-containing protein [Desulfospira joergensenii]|uniref:substrate-binding domain-containing protein n=1 Tax=Desulfospira joergensenii TaxID=53329 RepID=UPI0003B50A6B|nr:substrate-binding domain-containing protein [Desulfospira joergensenii]
MAEKTGGITNRVKEYRQKAKLSQVRLAELVGVKRQAVYDIESGRYLPNTGVALKLARHLGCRVEDLFYEEGSHDTCPVVMGEDTPIGEERVSVVKVRDQLVAYPVDGRFAFPGELRPADGVFEQKKGGIRFFGSESGIDNTVLLLGCDPAFSLLAAHASRIDPKLRMNCRFASTHAAVNRLVQGKAHLAGMHLHNRPGQEANVVLAREKLAKTGATLIGFSMMEEGIMVEKSNPFGIKAASDLAQPGIRFINREPGAALRVLLDELLGESRIPGDAIKGYETLVQGHNQGAQMVAYGLADAALGLQPVALAHGLDFVPLAEVRCDLVVPSDLMASPGIQMILNVLQSRDLRDEISFLPGYSQRKTGKTIASF